MKSRFSHLKNQTVKLPNGETAAGETITIKDQYSRGDGTSANIKYDLEDYVD